MVIYEVHVLHLEVELEVAYELSYSSAHCNGNEGPSSRGEEVILCMRMAIIID